MELDPDELAGVVDLFGGLTRDELRGAYADLAARSGEPVDPDALDAAVNRAIEEYYLVAVGAGAGDGGDGGGGRETGGGDDGETGDGEETGGARESDVGEGDELLVAGPTALPTLPDGGEDLPHLLEAGRRSVDHDLVGRSALSRLRGDAARAVNDGDEERIATLLDVCYDLEAWAPVETAELRERLDAAR